MTALQKLHSEFQVRGAAELNDRLANDVRMMYNFCMLYKFIKLILTD